MDLPQRCGVSSCSLHWKLKRAAHLGLKTLVEIEELFLAALDI
jgi:hypothetical protein